MQNVILSDGRKASIETDWDIVSIVESYCGHNFAVVLADRFIELEGYNLYTKGPGVTRTQYN